MDCLIIAVNYMFYSELNVFLYLNACDYITGLYVLCKSNWVSMYRLLYSALISPGKQMGVLQIGIRAKVSTLSLDGPVEWSLDRECEGNWAWNGQFRTLVCSRVSSSCLTALTSSGGLAVQ
jgi:hypothetical protein